MSDVSLILLFVVLFLGGVLALTAYYDRFGKVTFVTLLPYQRGVLFRHTHPVEDLGPGKHRVRSGIELLVHLDVRPIAVTYDNLFAFLPDGTTAVYGFTASAQVRDARRALYSARNYSQVPAAVLLRCLRHELSGSSGDSLRAGRESVAARLKQAAKTRLEADGFELLSFELTHLAVGSVRPQGPHPQPADTSPPA